jgi:hypothetical protein
MNTLPLVSACVLLGVPAPVCSGESRPTLKFAGSAPATVAIEEAFKMALDNLIEINGKSATEPFVSGSLHGEQHVTILLGQRPEPRPMSPSPSERNLHKNRQ